MQWLLSSVARLSFIRPPPKVYNYLAAILGIVVALQTVSKLLRAADIIHSEGSRRSAHQIHSPHDQTTERLWHEFVSTGGRVEGSSAAVTVQKVQLLTRKSSLVFPGGILLCLHSNRVKFR